MIPSNFFSYSVFFKLHDTIAEVFTIDLNQDTNAAATRFLRNLAHGLVQFHFLDLFLSN